MNSFPLVGEVIFPQRKACAERSEANRVTGKKCTAFLPQEGRVVPIEWGSAPLQLHLLRRVGKIKGEGASPAFRSLFLPGRNDPLLRERIYHQAGNFMLQVLHRAGIGRVTRAAPDQLTPVAGRH